MLSIPQKTINEKMPTFDILNLVKKEIINISIHIIDHLQYCI